MFSRNHFFVLVKNVLRFTLFQLNLDEERNREKIKMSRDFLDKPPCSVTCLSLSLRIIITVSKPVLAPPYYIPEKKKDTLERTCYKIRCTQLESSFLVCFITKSCHVHQISHHHSWLLWPCLCWCFPSPCTLAHILSEPNTLWETRYTLKYATNIQMDLLPKVTIVLSFFFLSFAFCLASVHSSFSCFILEVYIRKMVIRHCKGDVLESLALWIASSVNLVVLAVLFHIPENVDVWEETCSSLLCLVKEIDVEKTEFLTTWT